MANISSEALFHFTPKPEYLFQILQHEFRARYYPEKILFDGSTPFSRAIPMVCFCDIPLSQIKNHLDVYGSYGIGMSKKWALKKKLNPIMYVQPSSILSASIMSTLKTFVGKKVVLDKQKEGILNFFRYTKNYQGDFMRNGEIIPNVKFYNEREWRHIPNSSLDIEFWLKDSEYKNPTLLADCNDRAAAHPLSFEPEDIKYIIIKDESEIRTMIKALKRIKQKYDNDIIEILLSRIITTEQIMQDF